MIVFLFAAPKWAASSYTAANEREGYAESLMPKESEIQYFTSGAESQILNVALPEEEEDSVTCDAIVANILADASFTAELRDHGFSHLGCGVIVAPIVIPQARKPKCCGRHDMRELVQNAGDPLNRLVRLNAGETKNGDGCVIPLGDELL